MPLAAVGGKRTVMGTQVAAVMSGGKEHGLPQPEYFVSSTYAGEALSLAAARATIGQLQGKHDLQWLWDKGKAFWERFNLAAAGVVQYEGYPTRGKLVGDATARALFLQETCKAGIYFNGSPFFNFPLAEVAFDALGSISAVCQKIRLGDARLEGAMPKTPFAQATREKT